MAVQTNLPALAMEEVAPVAVFDTAMLAPEDVFAGKGDVKEEAELTQEDMKRRRAKKKRKFKDWTTSLKLGRISVGSAKPTKYSSKDLLTNAYSGKHDYEWLLTPPKTPLFQEGNEFQQSFTAPKTSFATRSTSTTKSSKAVCSLCNEVFNQEVLHVHKRENCPRRMKYVETVQSPVTCVRNM